MTCQILLAVRLLLFSFFGQVCGDRDGVSRSKSQGRTSMFKLSIPSWVQSLRFTHLFQEIKAIVFFSPLWCHSIKSKWPVFIGKFWVIQEDALLASFSKFWEKTFGGLIVANPISFLPPFFFYTDDILFQVFILDLLTRLSLSPSESFFCC